MPASEPTPQASRATGAGKASAATVDVDGLNVTYPGGIRAVEGVSLRLGEGEFVSIVGPSGCGKSTLLKALAGLVPVSRGTVRIGGEDIQAHGDHVLDLSFVFQAPTLLSWRTVLGNVRLPLELHPSYSGSDRQRMMDVLQWVGLDAFAKAYPTELSGGMQMRVSLARALVTRPHLLLLDEPFGALDDMTRQRLNRDLLSMWARDRWNALFVTHNVSEAVFLGQRVVVMSPRPGRIVADIAVTLPFPRADRVRTSQAFNDLVASVTQALNRTEDAP